MPISGLSVAYTAVGGIILWSGITGQTLSQTFKDIASGQAPKATASNAQSNTAAANVGSSGPVTANTVTTIQNYNLARLVASTYGWGTGQEFASLTEIIQNESGGNPLAANPSGAFGIAQALGHGNAATQGTYSDSYGGYGVPTSTCVAANSGSASAQLVWMMAYISQTYGDPIKAWSFHVANGYY